MLCFFIFFYFWATMRDLWELMQIMSLHLVGVNGRQFLIEIAPQSMATTISTWCLLETKEVKL